MDSTEDIMEFEARVNKAVGLAKDAGVVLEKPNFFMVSPGERHRGEILIHVIFTFTIYGDENRTVDVKELANKIIKYSNEKTGNLIPEII